MYRRDAGEEADLYVVQYVDLSEVADEKYLAILNAKLTDLKC